MGKNNNEAGKRLCHRMFAALIGTVSVAASPAAHALTAFTETTNAAGIAHSAESYGGAWGDLNSDGWPDLFVNNHRARPNLFLNRGDGSFTDVAIGADTSGLWAAFPQSDQHGGAWADYDNDGDQDLIVPTGQGYPNQFFVNSGGLLNDVADAAGLNNWDQSYRGPLWVDWSGDGLLDLVLSNFHGDFQIFDQDAGVFRPKPAETGLACRQGQFATIATVIGSRLELICHGEQTIPTGTYDLTTLPFLDISGQIPPVLSGRDVAIADFDGDGRFDLFFPRGRAERMSEIKLLEDGTIGGQILINPGQQKEFSFDGPTQITIALQEPTTVDLTKIRIGANGVNPVTLPFTLSADDPSVWGLKTFDPTLNRGIYIGFDVGAGRWQIIQSGGTAVRSTSYVVSGDTPPQNLATAGLAQDEWYVKPLLLHNDAGGIIDMSAAAGFNELLGCISTVAADFDNDSDVDIYMVCRGGITNLPNVLYWNNGDGTFTKAADAAGAAGSLLGVGENAMAADYDADGFVDLFVTNGLNLVPPYTAGPLQLFRNAGNSNHWLEFDLIGVVSNRDGIGAKVKVVGGGKTQIRFQDGGIHRWAQNHQRVHFGLGAETTVDVTVEWPSGQVDQVNGLAADRIYRFEEGLGATPVVLPAVTVPDYPLSAWGSYDYDAQNDDGVFVWKGLDGGWHLRAVGSNIHSGTILSATGFTSVVPVSVESGDLIDSATDPTQTVFSFATTPGFEDGIDFSVSAGDSPCLQLSNGAAAYVGAARHLLPTPIDLETLAPCSDQQPTPAPTYFLGAPSFDAGTEKGLFLWLDDAGVWHLRFTAGSTDAQYKGDLVSNEPFMSVLPYSLESNDIVDTSNPNRIHFALTMSGAYQDGIDFTFPSGTHVCLSLEIPVSASVTIGATRYVANLPLDLATGGPCGGSVPGVSIGDVDIDETGTAASFSVALTGPSDSTVSVDFATADGTAVAGSDYAATAGTLVFQPGEVTKTVDVSILDDAATEGDETFTVELGNLVNAAPIDLSGLGTIHDDEGIPCGAPTYDAGITAGLFLWKDCASGAWVMRATAGGGYATYLGDLRSDQPLTAIEPFNVETNDTFDATSPDAIHFLFQVGTVYQDGFSFTVPPGAHPCLTVDQPAGSTVLLGAGAAPTPLPLDLATLGACNDLPPQIDVAAATAAEDAGTLAFNLTLSEPTTQTVTVDVTTVDGSATAGSDYTAIATTVSFAPGEISVYLNVDVLNDTLAEGDEQFHLSLASPVGALLGNGIATGTITDDEASPCGTPSYDAGVDAAVFLWKDCTNGAWSARMTAGGATGYYVGDVRSDLAFTSVTPISVESNDLLDTTAPNVITYGLGASGIYQDGFDFTHPAAAHVCFDVDLPDGGVVMVGAGRLPLTPPFDLATLGPCSGLPPRVFVADTNASENAGPLLFDLSLSAPSTEPVSVDVTTVDDTAFAGADYTAAFTTVSFAPGETAKQVVVALLDDALAEGEERLVLQLSNPIGADLGNASASGTIMDDEVSPCGAPTFDTAVDAGVFLWKDCTTGTWYTRITAGGGDVNFTGHVTATEPFTAITPFNLEANDLFDTTISGQIAFGLMVSSTYQDGFEFSYPGTATACFAVDSPQGSQVFVGASRTATTGPFDLATLSTCTAQ